jgi:hypothetical protein
MEFEDFRRKILQGSLILGRSCRAAWLDHNPESTWIGCVGDLTDRREVTTSLLIKVGDHTSSMIDFHQRYSDRVDCRRITKDGRRELERRYDAGQEQNTKGSPQSQGGLAFTGRKLTALGKVWCRYSVASRHQGQ